MKQNTLVMKVRNKIHLVLVFWLVQVGSGSRFAGDSVGVTIAFEWNLFTLATHNGYQAAQLMRQALKEVDVLQESPT